jgi:hypothetical protein
MNSPPKKRPYNAEQQQTTNQHRYTISTPR